MPTPREVALSWFEKVWNERDAAAIDTHLASDARMHGLGDPMTPAMFKAFHQTFLQAFPDIRIDVVRTVAEGEYVAVHCHVTGTHCGAGLGCDPTNKPVDVWGMGIARIANGKIVEAWNSYDFMSLYQQVEMLPPLAPAPAFPVD